MKFLNTKDPNFDQLLSDLVRRDSGYSKSVTDSVAAILADVKSQGDQALIHYTCKFDGIMIDRVGELEVSGTQLAEALESIDPRLKSTLQYATGRIENYHRHQVAKGWNITDENGAVLGQRVTPLDKVGIYVPGGKAAYPSSVLMAAVPARLAGVGQVVMTVPTPDGVINQSVLAAAALAGVDRVFKIGGAQAIAALAYGTKTVPRVDKIVGPGNAYVATAKRMVFGEVGIDMIAGPSEVLVVSDTTVDPHWVAMDLFAQAEHDEMAQSIHVTDDERHHQDVKMAIEKLLPQQSRKTIIENSLSNQGALILAENSEQIADIINHVAPEHLELMSNDADRLLPRIRHAGSIFIGRHSAEVLGDYCAGPNHVLPTSGTARFSSPLGVYDFQKRSSVVRFDGTNVGEVAEAAAYLADLEGLTAHQCSALYRTKIHE